MLYLVSHTTALQDKEINVLIIFLSERALAADFVNVNKVLL